MSLLLKLLGARIQDASGISDLSLALRGNINLALVALLLATLGGLAWWLYLKSPQTIPTSRRRLLAGLRILFLALLLLVLLRPVLSFNVQGSVRRLLVVLLDQSASMKIKDPRVAPEDRKRAALALGRLHPTNGLGQALSADVASLDALARVDLAKAALENPKLDLLRRLELDYNLAPFGFGQSLVELTARGASNSPVITTAATPFPWVEGWESQSPQTALGDALRSLLVRQRGQPLAGVFVITDGANNSGTQPREVAAMFKQEGLPLYAYGVGVTSPRDVIVASLLAPDVAFAKDDVPVAVRVRSQGMNGRSAPLRLLLNDQPVAEQQVSFGSDGEQVVTLTFVPPAQGDYTLAAKIEPSPEEAAQDNNSASQALKVVDTRIKVLMVEQSPRWEFRYLQAMLQRDRRIELKCLLFEGDPAITRATNSPYIAQFPARKEDLFKYDLVILGDVDPRRLAPQNLENLNEWVSKFGGAVIAIAGKRSMPAAYRRTALEQMLPVELETTTLVEAAGDPLSEKPIRLELTANGRRSPMLRLSDREDESADLWRELPPVYWVARVARPKPAAEVLVVDPDPARESRSGKMPVLALQHYGLGQVMYVGTDNTWRWRRNAGDLYYTTLWGQMMHRLTLQRLLGGSKRTQLTCDRQNYMTGERITLYARLYTSSYEPLQDATVRGLYGLRQGGTARRGELVLRAIPEQPGLYRGEFTAPTPGQYQFFVEQDLNTPLDFNVTEPRMELMDTAMNQGLLTDLARATGGAFLREEDLFRLPELIAARTEHVKSPMEIELWSSPFYYLLMLSVLAAEWLLRKRSQLK
jgi:hypothetical protein